MHKLKKTSKQIHHLIPTETRCCKTNILTLYDLQKNNFTLIEKRKNKLCAI